LFVRKEFVLGLITEAMLVLIILLLVQSFIIAIADTGSGAAVTIYKSWAGGIVIETKTGIDVSFTSNIDFADHWVKITTCCGWYKVEDRVVEC